MSDTIMQDTVMQDADMQDTVMQDATTQDTATQDTTAEDTTTQDTVLPGSVRKIAKMRKPRENGVKPAKRKSSWRTTEKSHLLHLYTINNNIFRTEDGGIHYIRGGNGTLVRDMTSESIKHYPGGSLHASDPWVPRNYCKNSIRCKLRKLIIEEDELAVELEAELNAHYGIVPEPAEEQATIERQRLALEKALKQQERREKRREKILTERSARELAQREKDILRAKKIQEETRIIREEHMKASNEGVRFAFAKRKKPVIIDKTDA
ncbi:hypothetical protein EAE96_002704 [Botrytis aclada]|nr:hypothetical protein EAE96_002704 [Botrytis aclada]